MNENASFLSLIDLHHPWEDVKTKFLARSFLKMTRGTPRSPIFYSFEDFRLGLSVIAMQMGIFIPTFILWMFESTLPIEISPVKVIDPSFLWPKRKLRRIVMRRRGITTNVERWRDRVVSRRLRVTTGVMRLRDPSIVVQQWRLRGRVKRRT